MTRDLGAVGRRAGRLLLPAFAVALGVLLLAGGASAAEGDLDPAFGSGGIAKTTVGTYGFASSLLRQTDGKLILTGTATSPVTGAGAVGVARYNTDGSADTSFGSGGLAVIDVPYGGYMIGGALQPDGKIVVVGGARPGGQEELVVVRLRTDGTLDPSFGAGGIVTLSRAGFSAEAEAVAVQADGKIVAAGYEYVDGSPRGTSNFLLVRLNGDGSLDAGFGSGGRTLLDSGPGTEDAAVGVAIQSDGRIVATGSTTTSPDAHDDFAVVRLDTDGTPDTSFGTSGNGIVRVDTSGGGYDYAYGALIQPDQKIVAVGGNGNFALLRLNPDGSADAGFGVGGVATADLGGNDTAYSAQIQSDGKLVVGGYGGAQTSFALARLDSDGTLDPGFGNGGVVLTQAAPGGSSFGQGVVIQPDGNIVLGGYAFGQNAEFVLARYLGTPPSQVATIHVVGTQIADASGAPLVLRGVNYSGPEYMCVQGSPTPSTHGRGIFENWPNPPTPPEALLAWGINSVRLPLNEDCWLGINGVDPSFGGASYRQTIIAYVDALVGHGIVPIVELSGSAPGTTLAGVDQQPMPDRDHSVDFWESVAATFKADGQVVFDLFNEPFPDANQDTVTAWTCWRDGGSACPGLTYDAVGMQELVNIVRSAGARNLIVLGGVQYSRINASWLTYRPSDPASNLAASWHLYPNAYCPTTACWDTQFQAFVSQAAAVATEIGQGGSAPCGADFLDQAVLWLDAHNEGYLAWTWDAWGDCFSLIGNWGNVSPAFMPTLPYGRTYHDHLLGIPQPPTAVAAAAGDQTAALSWQAPADHGSTAIGSYKVTPHDQTAGTDGALVTVTALGTTIRNLTNGHVYTFGVTATNAAGTSASSPPSNAATPQPGYPTPAAASGTASPTQPTTLSTGADPATTGGTTTSLTVPGGTSGGAATIVQTGTSQPTPNGYLFGGVQVDINAPTASAANPLTVTFTTTPPADQPPPPDPGTLASTEIYRTEGTGTPTLVPDCAGPPGQAQPDPCVAGRQYVSINGSTDIRLTVLGSSASHWNSAHPKPATVTVGDAGYAPASATVQPGAAVNWTFASKKSHSATESVGLGTSGAALFDSGVKTSGSYRFVFPAAGAFAYRSSAKGDSMTGTILVPVVVTPANGRATTTFSVIWSTRTLSGYVFDVQYRFRAAGATGWKNWTSWKTGVSTPSGSFTPAQGAGTYAFHARLRNAATGKASAYSPDGTITVS